MAASSWEEGGAGGAGIFRAGYDSVMAVGEWGTCHGICPTPSEP